MSHHDNLGAYYTSPPYSPGGYQPASFWGDLSKNVGTYFQNQVYPNQASDFITTPELSAAQPNDPYALGSTVQAAAGAVIDPFEEFFKGLLRGVGVYVGIGIVAYTLIKAGKK